MGNASVHLPGESVPAVRNVHWTPVVNGGDSRNR